MTTELRKMTKWKNQYNVKDSKKDNGNIEGLGKPGLRKGDGSSYANPIIYIYIYWKNMGDGFTKKITQLPLKQIVRRQNKRPKPISSDGPLFLGLQSRIAMLSHGKYARRDILKYNKAMIMLF